MKEEIPQKWKRLRDAAELLLARDFLIGRPFDPSWNGDLQQLRLAIEALEALEISPKTTA